MISTLSGTVKYLTPEKTIIEIGGVGISVLINSHTSASLTIGAHAHLFTSLVVREDSLTLFGFSDEPSRVLFELVQTVSGIGPKVALSILGRSRHRNWHTRLILKISLQLRKCQELARKAHRG